MSEVSNGEQKEQKYLLSEIPYDRQKLHKYLSSLLIKGTSLLTYSYIGKLGNDRKFECENKPFIVFILALRRVLF